MLTRLNGGGGGGWARWGMAGARFPEMAPRWPCKTLASRDRGSLTSDAAGRLDETAGL